MNTILDYCTFNDRAVLSSLSKNFHSFVQSCDWSTICLEFRDPNYASPLDALKTKLRQSTGVVHVLVYFNEFVLLEQVAHELQDIQDIFGNMYQFYIVNEGYPGTPWELLYTPETCEIDISCPEAIINQLELIIGKCSNQIEYLQLLSNVGKVVLEHDPSLLIQAINECQESLDLISIFPVVLKIWSMRPVLIELIQCILEKLTPEDLEHVDVMSMDHISLLETLDPEAARILEWNLREEFDLNHSDIDMILESEILSQSDGLLDDDYELDDYGDDGAFYT